MGNGMCGYWAEMERAADFIAEAPCGECPTCQLYEEEHERNPRIEHAEHIAAGGMPNVKRHAFDLNPGSDGLAYVTDSVATMRVPFARITDGGDFADTLDDLTGHTEEARALHRLGGGKREMRAALANAAAAIAALLAASEDD